MRLYYLHGELTWILCAPLTGIGTLVLNFTD